MRVQKKWIILGIFLSLFLGLGIYKRQGIFNLLAKKYNLFYYSESESKLAHRYLDGLKGLEIGASAQNPFGLNTLNIDYSDDYTTVYKQAELKTTGTYAKVDIIASGDLLPLENDSQDFIVNSHVIEHFYDPIKAIKEWLRVVKPGGYVFIIAPHKERTFDKDRPRTTLAELIDRHEFPNPPIPDHHGHYSVWITEDFIELCDHFHWNVVAYQDVDDKVGNGFTVVIQKEVNNTL